MKRLEDKFKRFVNGYIGSSMLTNTEYPEAIERNAKECVKIADEYAVEFAEWVLRHSISYLECDVDTEESSVEKLLEIFKEDC